MVENINVPQEPLFSLMGKILVAFSVGEKQIFKIIAVGISADWRPELKGKGLDIMTGLK